MSDPTRSHPFLPPEVAGVDEEERRGPDWEAPKATSPEERQFFSRHKRLFIVMLPLFFWFIAANLALFTLSNYGLSWDEVYYHHPYELAGEWMKKMVTAADKPTSREDIQNYFSQTSELPSFSKIIYGIAYSLFSTSQGPLRSIRLVSVFAFATLIVLIYYFTRQYFGLSAAIAAALLYMFMPRAFGHAHLAATESITALIYFLTLWAFVKGLGRRRWSFCFAVFLGAAFATRVNCLFLPIILLGWALFYYKKESVNNLYAMIFITPLATFVLWPWLWPDPFWRFAEYLKFFSGHTQIPVVYLGNIYNGEAGMAPWHYPLIMLGVTLPLGHILFIVMGFVILAARMKRLAMGGLILVTIVIQIALASFPSTPKYDGVRLFFPVLPFLAIAGGVGFAVLGGWGGGFEGQRSRPRAIIAISLLAFTVLISGWKMCSLPSSLLYFNGLKSAITAASDKPEMVFETSYWGETLNKEMLDTLNKLPPETRIRPLAIHAETIEHLQKWGMLRRDLVFDAPPPYDYHLLQLRPSFFARPEWTLWTSYTPVKSIDAGGMPVMMLYKTGQQFETEWPRFKIKQ